LEKPDIRSLGVFFRPKRVAVIGASERLGSWGYTITRNIVQGGFTGDFYPINPNAKQILGFKAYSRLSEIPVRVDLALIVLPPGKVLGAMEACVSKGVKGVVVVSSGFGEVSAEGRRLEKRLAEIAAKGGVYLLGPNCSGFFNLSYSLNASGLDGLFLRDIPIAFVTQSGYSVDNLALDGYFSRLGFCKYVHTGNESGLTCADFLEYFGRDLDTKVILLYMEGVTDGKRFVDVAKEVTARKPIVAFKAGRTIPGAKAMLSHTGSIAGADQIFDSIFKQAGIIRVKKLEEILRVGHAFIYYPLLKGNRIGIFTMGGGWGVILADALTHQGLKVVEFPDSFRKQLASIGNMPPWVSLKNPIDIGAAFGEVSHPSKTLKMLEFILSHGNIDGIIIHGFGRLGIFSRKRQEYVSLMEDELELLDRMCELAQSYSKPLLLCSPFAYKSQTFNGLAKRGRIFHQNIDEVATILSALNRYYLRNG